MPFLSVVVVHGKILRSHCRFPIAVFGERWLLPPDTCWTGLTAALSSSHRLTQEDWNWWTSTYPVTFSLCDPSWSLSFLLCPSSEAVKPFSLSIVVKKQRCLSRVPGMCSVEPAALTSEALAELAKVCTVILVMALSLPVHSPFFFTKCSSRESSCLKTEMISVLSDPTSEAYYTFPEFLLCFCLVPAPREQGAQLELPTQGLLYIAGH